MIFLNEMNNQTLAFVTGAVLIILIAYQISKKLCEIRKARKLEKVCAEKRKIREEKIRNSETYLKELKSSPERRLQIISLNASDLVNMLKDGEVTSVEILLTFYERAASLGKSLELLADVNMEYAFKKAQELDARRLELLRAGKPLDSLGLFCGLPMSVKDIILVEGLDATGGCAITCLKPYSKDGLVAEILKKEGLIPFVQSNVPQALMITETVNFIYGRAKNPHNKERTTGGSSGGEGGLIASCCTPIGIGTDIGGSVRIPALYNGIYSLKPGFNRVTYEGVYDPGMVELKTGNIFILPVVGPMAKSTEDINLMMKALLSPEAVKAEPRKAPMPWREEIVREKVNRRIGFVVSDPFFEASPANKRAVLEAVKALRDQGHECLELRLPNLKEAVRVFLAVFSVSTFLNFLKRAVGDEKLIKEYGLFVMASKVPARIKGLTVKLLKTLGMGRFSYILESNGPFTSDQLMSVSILQQKITDNLIKTFTENKLDAFITPLGLPALKHGESEYLSLSVAYTLYWNVTNMPTGAVPVSYVREDEETYSDLHNDIFTAAAKKSLIGSRNLPVGVQISTLPFREELCLNIMSELENKIKFKCARI